MNAPFDEIGDERRARLVGDMHHLDARLSREIGARKMRRGADPGRSVVDRSRLRPGEIDKRLQGAGAEGRRDDNDGRRFSDQGDAGKIAHGIERQTLVQRSEYGMTGIDEQKGVAVGGCGHHGLRRDEAAGAGTI